MICVVKSRKVAMISVPFGLGAGRAGAEMGPESMRQAGLNRRLKQLGIDIASEYEIPCPSAKQLTGQQQNAKYLTEVIEVSKKLSDQVSEVVASHAFPLILGGDHSIAIGSIAGLSRHYQNLGVIWFDAHSDLNTEDTSPSGNIHGMSLATALGWTHLKLTDVNGSSIPIQAKNVVIIGARDLDPGEREFIRSNGIACYTMHEIDRMGMERVIQEALHIAGNGTDGIHLSFDVDSVDPLEAPGTGTPVRGGVSYREAHFALELLCESGAITSADFVEVNPLYDQNYKTARLATELIGSLLGERIL